MFGCGWRGGGGGGERGDLVVPPNLDNMPDHILHERASL